VAVTFVNVPQALPEQEEPEADHVTPLLLTSFCNVAVTGNDWEMVVPPRFGEMETLMAPAVPVRVMVAEAFRELYAAEVAVRVTVAGFGTEAGAVYVMGTPELLEVAEREPHVAPLQPEPLSDHRTLLLRRVVVTVAVNCCLPPGAATVAVLGETVTVVPD
jgi:hypothetical protein